MEWSAEFWRILSRSKTTSGKIETCSTLEGSGRNRALKAVSGVWKDWKSFSATSLTLSIRTTPPPRPQYFLGRGAGGGWGGFLGSNRREEGRGEDLMKMKVCSLNWDSPVLLPHSVLQLPTASLILPCGLKALFLDKLTCYRESTYTLTFGGPHPHPQACWLPL